MIDKKNQITEIKCTCNQCGKVWHYLKSEVTQAALAASGNMMVGCGSCCNPFGAYYLNKSGEISRAANDKFNKCPNCQSIDIKKEEITIERPVN